MSKSCYALIHYLCSTGWHLLHNFFKSNKSVTIHIYMYVLWREIVTHYQCSSGRYLLHTCLKRKTSVIIHMGWLRLVGSFKLQVSFAKEPYKRDYILQKRRIILRSLLIIATPQNFIMSRHCHYTDTLFLQHRTASAAQISQK